MYLSTIILCILMILPYKYILNLFHLKSYDRSLGFLEILLLCLLRPIVSVIYIFSFLLVVSWMHSFQLFQDTDLLLMLVTTLVIADLFEVITTRILLFRLILPSNDIKTLPNSTKYYLLWFFLFMLYSFDLVGQSETGESNFHAEPVVSFFMLGFLILCLFLSILTSLREKQRRNIKSTNVSQETKE